MAEHLIMNRALDYVDGKNYEWGKRDCLGLLAYCFDYPDDYFREPWMSNKHLRTIIKARRDFGTVREAYLDGLIKRNFRIVQTRKQARIFVTEEEDHFIVRSLRNPVDIKLKIPFAILGLVTNGQHIYFGNDGLYKLYSFNLTYLG